MHTHRSSDGKLTLLGVVAGEALRACFDAHMDPSQAHDAGEGCEGGLAPSSQLHTLGEEVGGVTDPMLKVRASGWKGEGVTASSEEVISASEAIEPGTVVLLSLHGVL
jgi:hypothetical protein